MHCRIISTRTDGRTGIVFIIYYLREAAMAERQVEVNELKFCRRDRWDLSVGEQTDTLHLHYS